MGQKKLYIETPVFESKKVGLRLEKHIYLKMECFQRVGSFKIRGIGALCQKAISEGKKHLVSSSGGNAGYAAAYAARKLGIKATVIVPKTTSIEARNSIEIEEAEVIVHGENWNAAHSYALDYANKINGFIVHPYDNPTIWKGHSTMIDEAARQCHKPDVVVLSVGGGGLLCGVLEGMHNNNWHDVPVIAVETEGAASFNAAIKAGRIVSLDKIETIATSLGAKEVAEKTIEWSNEHEIISSLVSDKDALDACKSFANDHRVLVEPACGASLSLMYNNHDNISDYENVLFIVCGGMGVNLDKIMGD